MFLLYVNAALTYVTIGLASAVFFHFIIRRPLLGNFWGALIVGLVGAVLGGLLDQLLAPVITALANFNSVNIFAAVAISLGLIWGFSKVSSR